MFVNKTKYNIGQQQIKNLYITMCKLGGRLTWNTLNGQDLKIHTNHSHWLFKMGRWNCSNWTLWNETQVDKSAEVDIVEVDKNRRNARADTAGLAVDIFP